MLTMLTKEATPLEIESALIGTLELEDFEVPYVDLEDLPFVHTTLIADGTGYSYDRSFPVRGHSAVMPAAVRELLGRGKQVLVAERRERYLVYVA